MKNFLQMKKNIILIGILGIFLYSCTTKTNDGTMKNPLLEKWNTAYEIPPFEQIKLEHYLPAFDQAMKMHNAEIEAIVNNKETATFVNTIEALEYSGSTLNKISAVLSNLLSSNWSEEFQVIADSIMPLLSVHEDNIYLNQKLFERIKFVYENKEKENLSPEQERLLEESYKGFVRGGANLALEKQERFKEINQELTQLTLNFDKNVLGATNAFKLEITNESDLAGLPDNFKEGAKVSDSLGNVKWIVSLNNPSLLPFLQYAENRDLREKIWRAYSSRCNGGEFDNNQIINKIVNLRIERANILGYSSHADFVLEETMAKNSQSVYDLLLKVWKPALAKAIEERNIYIKKSGLKNIEPWDWRYYTEIIRKEQYDLDESEISKYFSVENVQTAIFDVCNKLYGLKFVENKTLPKYDPDVISYEVFDNDKVISILYIDYYVRPSKSSGAWMTEYRIQHETQDGNNVIPIVSLVLNFPKPTGDTPSLLSFDDTETFFHEFGHAVHGMLSKCRYASISGTNVPRDFVEFPSQFMENYAINKEVLKTYAKHYLSGEIISDQLIEKILKAGTYGQGFTNVELIAASLLDMDYHVLTTQTNINPIEFENAAMAKIGLIPEIISRYKSQYFKHIFTGSFGYSSGYYSYTWSAVYEADAFELFKEKGIFDKETANSFRNNVLEIGNTKDLKTQYLIFRGQEPQIKPLLEKRGLK